MSEAGRVTLRGEVRSPGAAASPGTVTLDVDGVTVSVAEAPPWTAAYRDLATVAVDAGVVLAVLGEGPAAERWLFERFGDGIGTLVRGLRDGRLRQWLRDGLVEVADDAPVELVEYRAGDEAGVAQLFYHDRGAVLAPLDERRRRRRVRRADIGAVELQAETGGIRVAGRDGWPLAAASPDGDLGGTRRDDTLELLHLGPAATAHRDRWLALRDSAAADAAAIVAGLVPDAPFGLRRAAAATLLEGRPAAPADLGPGWARLEEAVLVDPAFAASYQALVAMAGGPAAPRWIVAAPRDPGLPQDPMLWSFVGLPGNLVAMELVSGGAHATYLFRVVPRAASGGSLPDGALEAAVAGISEALLDARFLREPMALPAARLAEPAALRYRLALAALPSLAAARRRFVARIVHRDPASWSAALADLIAWHATARDDEAEWPGRTTQEAMVDEAAAGG